MNCERSTRFTRRRAVGWAAIVLCLVVSGCAGPRFLAERKIRENPLTATLQLVGPRGPQVSERTWNTLRRFDLEDNYKRDWNECFATIRQRINEHPDAELIYALSELSYVEGKRAESLGQDSDALNLYGITLTNSYDYLFSEDLELTRNPYDPQFRAVCDLYNESLEDTLRILCQDNHLEPGQTYSIKTPGREFIVRTEMRGKWKPDEFDRYEFVSDYEVQTLNNRHTTYGLGVPLIAVRRPIAESDRREKYYAQGLSYSVTALMRCIPPENGRSGDSRVCVLEFFDPLAANQVQLSQRWVPLETDLTTPLAFFLDSPEFRKRNRATEGLLNPNHSQRKRGLYMLEPYDPERIPVLMVHGLWSSPMTWMDMFNDLRSFPEIRERYQFWFYLYPSGQPFWISATQLRSDLVAMRDVFDPTHQHAMMDEMVLVGHSMGGLVSRMQTIESRDQFWKIVSNQPIRSADQALMNLRGPDEARTKLVSTLFFKPNRSVKRVITIATPHEGSEFANDFTRWLARLFIKLPTRTVSSGLRLASENPGVFKDSKLLTVANAIDSLAPDSPIFPVMKRAPRAPGVSYHNIIGVLENPSFLTAQAGIGDGVVEKASAELPFAESELIVDADHSSIHMNSKTIYEVRRILLQHLRELDWRGRVAEQMIEEPIKR